MPAARLRILGNHLVGSILPLYMGRIPVPMDCGSSESYMELSEYFKWLGPSMRSLSEKVDY